MQLTYYCLVVGVYVSRTVDATKKISKRGKIKEKKAKTKGERERVGATRRQFNIRQSCE